MNDQDKYIGYMRQCIELARIAKERGDSAAGCVIVKDGLVIAEGIEGGSTHTDITFHAEIEAVRQARLVLKSGDLSDCIMVTTHEPCIMCAYVIRHHRIGLIVYGVSAGEIGGVNSALPVLTDRAVSRWGNPPKIIGGILEQECKDLRV